MFHVACPRRIFALFPVGSGCGVGAAALPSCLLLAFCASCPSLGALGGGVWGLENAPWLLEKWIWMDRGLGALLGLCSWPSPPAWGCGGGLGFASSPAEEGPWGCRGADGEELHPVEPQVEWGSRPHTAQIPAAV